MSKITKRSHHKENDEDADIPSTKHHPQDDSECVIKASTAQLTSRSSAEDQPFYIYNTYDRPADASAEGVFAQNGTYEVKYEDKPGRRFWRSGYLAEAGVGRVKAEYSVLEFRAKGPNASVKAELSKFEVGAMAGLEIASVKAKAGPFSAKLGLGLDTGACIGLGGVKAKFLGTGFSIGPKISVFYWGSELSISLW